VHTKNNLLWSDVQLKTQRLEKLKKNSFLTVPYLILLLTHLAILTTILYRAYSKCFPGIGCGRNSYKLYTRRFGTWGAHGL